MKNYHCDIHIYKVIIVCKHFFLRKNEVVFMPNDIFLAKLLTCKGSLVDCLTSPFTTLVLGSQPKQGLAKVWANNEAQESHFMFPRM